MQVIENVIICCAGSGNRLGLNNTKCLLNINDTIKIIDILLDAVESIPNVFITTGYNEEEVIEYISTKRDDVIFVRNPNYASTNASYSVNIALQFIKDSFICIDGDLILNKKDFKHFITKCSKAERCILGYTETNTEEPVYVKLNDNKQIVGFSRKEKEKYEWCGITFIHKKDNINFNKQWLDQCVQNLIPIDGCNIEAYEVDTPKDFKSIHERAGHLINLNNT